MSSHLTNIPEAVRLAASPDPSIDPQLKRQAIEYLQKVRELSEETWQDCLALYLQGAGAAGPSNSGKDGKEKLNSDLRLYCQQVVDSALIHKAEGISPEAFQAMYDALVAFVRTEWVEGPCEGNQSCKSTSRTSIFRNKLAFTITHLFLNTFPLPIPTFLHPFFELLAPPDPSSSKQNFHPVLLSIRILTEIALEIHDATMKSARSFSAARQDKDGETRDKIRKLGDEKLAVSGLLGLAQKGLEVIESGQGDRAKWIDVSCQALRTLASWTPWVDLSVALTPETLTFYHRLIRQPIAPIRTAAANILRTLVGKGIKEPAERLQVLSILDVITVLDPLEAETKQPTDDEEIVAFRAAIGGVLQQYGSDLVGFIETTEYPEDLRNNAETMITNALPLLLRFFTDKQPDVALAVHPFVTDLLRIYKKWHVPKPAPPVKGGMRPPPTPSMPVSPERRKFLAALLDVCVRQLAWPDDAEWEVPGSDEPDPEDDLAKFWTLRMHCSRHIEVIAQIDKTLHTEVVANIVASTLNRLQSGGTSAVTWQEAELALHLVHTFGELTKNNTIAAFFELPPEIVTKAGRDRQRRIELNKNHIDSEMSSGRTTPTNGDMSEDALAGTIPGVYYGGQQEKFDYSPYPLTTLGTLLTLCQTVGIVNYPHPSVPLMYFKIAVRYVEFWKAKEGTIQPMFEAMLDQRGIHHPDEAVRRRDFWTFARFVKECRSELDQDMIAPILDSFKDLLVIDAKVPEPDTPDEDVLVKATLPPSYLSDQLHLFEAAGNLVYATRSDANKQMSLLEAVAGPLMAAIGDGLQRPSDPQAVIQVHHYLMALGNFAKGFPQVSDSQIEALPYTPVFKRMTEALLEALDVMKTQRIVRDAARFAFSQFVSAIGSTIAELVSRFVSHVVTEFEPTELVDFILFLNLLMHRLKNNAFETMDMLFLPLLSQIFVVLRSPMNGTDDVNIHTRLKEAYLMLFQALMNANMDGVFISNRNKAEFENLLNQVLSVATNPQEGPSQRAAITFFARSVTAWGTSTAPSVFADSAASELSKAVANGSAAPTNQHTITKEERAARAYPGYEAFIYQRLLSLCFEIPANPKFRVNSGQQVLYELAMLMRNTVAARGQEAVNYLLNELLPKLQCPPDVAEQLIGSLRTQQARDFRKTYVDFIRAIKGGK